MLKVGITGGIGSGKSTVAKVFEVLGIPVYYADTAAKLLMNEDEALKTLLREHFGEAIYKEGKLDRSLLSSLVFNDKQKLELLNSLIHPATINAGLRWMQEQTTPYAIKEAALIFESGSQEHLDVVIGVYAPVSLRIQRVMERDKITREEVQRRMQYQIDEDIKMRLCDFVIVNDEQEMVIPQVLQLHEKLLAQLQPS
jgi:dephospho-CoA kinase